MKLPAAVWLFLYGSPNIVGSFLGLAGLVLFFIGLIGPGWPFIVLGLYVLGWLLAWQLASRQEHLEIAREAHADNLLRELDRIISRVGKRLPEASQTRLLGLRETLAELLPRLADSSLFSQELHTVEKTVRDYLPATLENYLRLPPLFARLHRMNNGNTAQAMLLEQLVLLDERMQAMLANVLSEDARALTENGLFLEQKFRPQDFFSLK
jgi:hypothetical protein